MREDTIFFFEKWSWFKPNNFGLTQGIAFELYTSVANVYHLYSSRNFTMQKVKASSLTAGINKNSFKRSVEMFVANENKFSLMR